MEGIRKGTTESENESFSLQRAAAWNLGSSGGAAVIHQGPLPATQESGALSPRASVGSSLPEGRAQLELNVNNIYSKTEKYSVGSKLEHVEVERAGTCVYGNSRLPGNLFGLWNPD